MNEQEGQERKSIRERVGPDYHKRRHAVRYIILFLLLLVAAASAYWFFLKPEPKKATPQPAPSPSARQSNVISSRTESHTSQNFALEFSYPSNWTVTDEPGSGILTVKSPDLQLTDKDGKKTTGQIIMTIKNKQQPLPEFDEGNAIAARESDKVAYTKPSQTQRGNTYLSFLRFASSTGSSGDFDGVYITGDTGYQKDQAVPKADFTPVDPVISITYIKDDKQFTVADNMWDDPDYSKPVLAMLQSLSIN